MSITSRNRLLGALPPAVLARLSKHLSPVQLLQGDLVLGPEQRVDFVYFPNGALLSMITDGPDGQSVETSMVGLEGAGGLLEVCGSGRSSLRCLVQVGGAAHRAPAAAVRALVREDEGFFTQALQAIEFQLAESRQSGFCQALHPVEVRLARWLVEASERCGGLQTLPLTQEFLAAMLGVQRTTVTAFATQLQQMGLIRYSRGKIELLDIAGLEAAACECRNFTRAERERLGFGVAEEPAAA